MYFDFEDGHPPLEPLPSALTRREGVLLAIIAHLLTVIAVLVIPELPWVQQLVRAAEVVPVEPVQPRQPERPRFVLVQPRVDLEALRPPPTAPLSDLDRQAAAPQVAPGPANRQPRSLGNSPEYVERTAPSTQGRGAAQQSPSTNQESGEQAQDAANMRLPDSEEVTASNRSQAAAPTAPTGGLGSLREALQNIDRYTEREQFHNPDGGGAYGPWIQFDSKGVEFGPWIRRFIAQVKRNWFVPYAAMSLKGHVVITFNVHRNGALTDLTVVAPSNVGAFNHAAFNALVLSNPTQPLPAEYPDDRAFFTVTFFYNETPPPAP
jgi:TonB family protein